MGKTIIKSWPDLNKAREILPKIRQVNYLGTFDYPELRKHFQNHKYYIRTYGCQANTRDTEVLKGILETFGMSESAELTEATIIILNTCAVRSNAEDKVFGQIGELKNLKGQKREVYFGVCGCMVHQPEVLKMVHARYPFIDFIFGTDQIADLGEILQEMLERDRRIIDVQSGAGHIVENLPSRRSSPVQAFVNIMYGCDKFCTYCIVPFTRGRQRSRTKEDILKEVQTLKDQGYLEVTLLGQNVNAYGKDLASPDTFASLLDAVAKIGIPRVRFLTSHPWDFSLDLIKTIKDNANIVRFLHLPLQSGSDRILKDMGRRYSAQDYRNIYYAIKKEIPEMVFSTDIIVGFPSEEYQDFLDTLSLVEELEFAQYFTFIFSPRLGTKAAQMTSVSTTAEQQAWFQILTDLCAKKLAQQNLAYLGQTIEVLVESVSKKNEQVLTGYSRDNKVVHFVGPESLINKIVPIKITAVKTFALFGELVNDRL